MGFNQRQLFALVLVVVLLANMTLLALKKINELVFWSVLGGCAVLWFVLKRKWA